MKYVRTVESVAQEVITTNPATIFHPDLAAMFTEYEDSVDVGVGYALENGTWSAPPEPEVEPEVETDPV
ncbi:hypothetical protein OAA60_00100 [Porticoccaceae bacterium]|nr:hypothetical protein [Porticoccaceae bacterium]